MRPLQLLAVAIVLPAAFGAERQCVAVDGEWVTAGDLAPTIGAFRNLPAEKTLVHSPAPGTSQILSRFVLQRLAGTNAVPSGQPSVCVERRTRKLEPGVVEEALRHSLIANGVGGEPHLIRYIPDTVPSGQLNFGSAPPSCTQRQGVPQVCRLRASYVYGRARSLVVDVEFRLEGSKIDGSGTRQTVGNLVRPNDLVKVHVEGANTRLVFEARASSAGRLGSTVLLENPTNHRRFAGKVTGADEAAVLVKEEQK